jgi:hypothetical protein
MARKFGVALSNLRKAIGQQSETWLKSTLNANAGRKSRESRLPVLIPGFLVCAAL